LLAGAIDHAVRRGAEAVVGPACEQVADIDDESIFDALREQPLPIPAIDLQPTDISLIDERQAPVVGMRRDAELLGSLFRLLRWIVDGAATRDRLGDATYEVVLVEAKRDRKGAHELPADDVGGIEIAVANP